MTKNGTTALRRVQFTRFVEFGKPAQVVEGWFHRWAQKPDQVVAIVEADDGQVYEVVPTDLKFLKRQIPSEYDDIITR